VTLQVHRRNDFLHSTPDCLTKISHSNRAQTMDFALLI